MPEIASTFVQLDCKGHAYCVHRRKYTRQQSLISVHAGAMLLQVPKEALMTADSALTSSKFAAKVSEHGPDLSHEQVGLTV